MKHYWSKVPPYAVDTAQVQAIGANDTKCCDLCYDSGGGLAVLSLRISLAAVRAYDELKRRPDAQPRHSDARDSAVLAAVTRRVEELVSSYRVSGHHERGITYVFWTEVQREISAGAFDDLLDRL